MVLKIQLFRDEFTIHTKNTDFLFVFRLVSGPPAQGLCLFFLSVSLLLAYDASGIVRS